MSSRAVVLAAVQAVTGVFALVSLWTFLVAINPRWEFFLGSPLGIAREIVALCRDGRIWNDVSITLLETVVGLVIGEVVGSALGIAMWWSRWFSRSAHPLLVSLGATPVFGLGPIIVFWCGTGLLSKVMLAGLAATPVAALQAYQGASSSDSGLLSVARAFGATRGAVLRRVALPSALLWMVIGLRINIGMAMLGAIVGEFVSSRAGLGNLLIVAEGLYNVNQMFAAVLGICLIAIVLQAGALPLHRWATARAMGVRE